MNVYTYYKSKLNKTQLPGMVFENSMVMQEQCFFFFFLNFFFFGSCFFSMVCEFCVMGGVLGRRLSSRLLRYGGLAVEEEAVVEVLVPLGAVGQVVPEESSAQLKCVCS